MHHDDDERTRRLATAAQALAGVDPRTALRLGWPSAADHLAADADGKLVRNWRGTWIELESGAHEVVRAASDADWSARGGRGVWFGAASGRGLDAALRRGERYALWESDPALLRIVLGRCDWAPFIASGQLEIVMGADLIHLARALGSPDTFTGPVVADRATAHMRPHELRLLCGGGARPIALLVEGRLLVDAVGGALDRRGIDTYQLDVEGLSREELDLAVTTLAPQFALAINETSGLADWSTSHDLPLVVWEIDPSTDEPRSLTAPAPAARVFSYRRAHLDGFRRAGYTHVDYLPLAADSKTRRPRRALGPDRVRYASNVAFVGASMASQAQVHLEGVAKVLESLREGDAQGLAADLRGLERALAEQCADFDHYRLPKLVEQHAPEALRLWAASDQVEDMVALVAEFVAGKKRAAAIDAVAFAQPHVWGDAGWQDHLSEFTDDAREQVRYRGPAGNREQIEHIFSGATVNLDVGRAYQNDIATLRTFDVLACGGLCLAEHNDALDELFDVGVELDTWRTLAELAAKTKEHLANPERAAAIGANGRRAITERHSLDLRLDHMLAGIAEPILVRAA